MKYRTAFYFFAFLTAVRALQPRAITITDSSTETLLSPRSTDPPLQDLPDPNDPGFVFAPPSGNSDGIDWDPAWDDPVPFPFEPAPPVASQTTETVVEGPFAYMKALGTPKHMPAPGDTALHDIEQVRFGVSKDTNLALYSK